MAACSWPILRGSPSGASAPQGSHLRMRSERAAAPVSRETLCRRLGCLPPCFPPKIRRQNSERRRGHAVEPTRLPHGSWPSGLEFCTGLVRETGHVGIIDIGQDQAFVAPEGVDIGGLALEV